MSIEIKDIKLPPGKTDKDMVDIVKEIYPKHSKAIYSECKRGHLYGIDLREDAKAAICKRLGIPVESPQKSRQIDRHLQKDRITCRLSKEAQRRFELVFAASGLDTKQDWVRPRLEREINREYERLVRMGRIREVDIGA